MPPHTRLVSLQGTFHATDAAVLRPFRSVGSAIMAMPLALNKASSSRTTSRVKFAIVSKHMCVLVRAMCVSISITAMVLENVTWELQQTQRHQGVIAASRHAVCRRQRRTHVAATRHRSEFPALQNRHREEVNDDRKPCRTIRDVLRLLQALQRDSAA